MYWWIKRKPLQGLLTSSRVADAGGAAGGGQDGHGVCVTELQSVSFLHSVVTRQKSELHHLRQTGQQRFWKHKHNYNEQNSLTHTAIWFMYNHKRDMKA